MEKMIDRARKRSKERRKLRKEGEKRKEEEEHRMGSLERAHVGFEDKYSLPYSQKIQLNAFSA